MLHITLSLCFELICDNLFLSNSESIREDEIPSDIRTLCADYRQELIEHVSNVDEKLGEMFLGNAYI